MLPNIPRVPGGLVKRVCALARAAGLFRGLLAPAAGRQPGVLGLLVAREDAVLLANAVVDRWLGHLGLPDGADRPADATGPPRRPPPAPRRRRGGCGRGR